MIKSHSSPRGRSKHVKLFPIKPDNTGLRCLGLNQDWLFQIFFIPSYTSKAHSFPRLLSP